jgi:hypothetical protein
METLSHFLQTMAAEDYYGLMDILIQAVAAEAAEELTHNLVEAQAIFHLVKVDRA